MMNRDGILKDDVKVPDGDVGKAIQSDFDAGKTLLITTISAMNEEAVCPLSSKWLHSSRFKKCSKCLSYL